MSLSLQICDPPAYAVAPKALRRWAGERLRRERRDDGRTVYSFAISGSTCNNRPLDVVMTVTLDPGGRIESATSQPAPSDAGCDATCAAHLDGRRFLAEFGSCEEAVGLELRDAAFRNWEAE